MNTVGIRELRQNLTACLRQVERGEVLVVTQRNRPVAQLGPLPSSGSALERLAATGRVTAPVAQPRPFRPVPLADPHAATNALAFVRGED